MADSGSGVPIIQTSNLDETFQALRNQDPARMRENQVPHTPDYKHIPNQNFAPTTSVSGAFGGGMTRFASAAAGGGMIYGQPQFFSPVHTPINWQIPSKRLEIYQWTVLPHTQILLEDFTYSDLENTPFGCSNIIEDSLTGGFIFETSDYPKIMNSEGIFNQPPRIGMRDCNDKKCFSFEPVGNHRAIRISEEHYIFVLDGKSHRKNRKVLDGKKSRAKRGIIPNGVEKVKIQDKLIKRVQAHEVKRSDYLLTPVPQVGNVSINKDMAWLIGFCIADGMIANYNSSYNVRFTGCKDEKALIRCQEILKENFDSTISSKQHGEGKGWRVCVTTKKAYEFFSRYIVNKGTEKKFSKAVFDLDRETRLNILAGYFDGDGLLSKDKNLVANCYSKDLADQIYWMLISCKIVGSLGKYPLYGTRYPTDSDCCYRIFVPSSQVTNISSYMRGDKVALDFIPKKERALKFYHTEDGVTYLAQPIDKIEEFSYTGKGFDIEMPNERKALVADGYVCSNCRFFYQNEPKVAASIDFYCFEPHTQILMADGSQQCISSVVEGDLVRSHDGSINRVVKVNKRATQNEKMLKIKIAGICGEDFSFLKVTPGHKIFVDSNNKIKCIEAGSLKKGDFLLSPCNYDRDEDFKISNDFAWLIGIYAAEGCGIPYEHEDKKGAIEKYYKGVYFTLNINEYDTLAKEIRDKIIKIYGDISVTVRTLPSYGQTVVSAYGQNIADDLNGSCPGLSSYGTKRLSPWIMKCSKENLIHFLAGFYSGDGCYNTNNGFQGVGVSRKLADQIANICDIIGVEYSYTKTRLPSPSQTVYNIRISRRACGIFDKLSYKIKESKNIDEEYAHNIPYFVKDKYMYRKIYSIQEYVYDGDLYDLSIENQHSYVANRISVHNSGFPMNDYENECKDRDVKKYFDKLKNRLEISKWLRLISHEVHLLGDCFPFVEISCENCGGTGKNGDELCEHDGGTVRRIVILNPDYVEVYTSPINPEAVIALKPDEELINMVQKRTPGYDRLTPDVRALVSAGRPIRLDNRNVYHLKYGEGGYDRYGTGMVRRLFPILSYKTKLMVAQWIVAERLIIPIKIVKVGNDERPAGPADIAAVQEQLAQTVNDPNLTIVTHHAFELDWYGSAGKVLTLSNEFDLINQEILDGMMINNALLNGEGPSFSNAAVGIEAMIERLQTFRREVANWVEQKIYLPEAKRQGFIDENANSEEEEYIYPKIKWNSMHLRDQQQFRTFVLQLYEKGLLSAQTVLEAFDFDPDQEIERKRYDAIQLAVLGGGMGGAGGAPGGDMGGGFGGMGGGGGGGGMPPMPGMGGEAGGIPGGDMGGAPGGAPISAPPGGAPAAPMASVKNSITTVSETNIANPSNYGGKILKQKTRERMDSEKMKVYKKMQSQKDNQPGMTGVRDAKGRIIFTKCERQLLDQLQKYSQNGLIRYPIVPQFEVKFGSITYPIDFAFPHLKIALEADGEAFHSSPKQIEHDKERDMKLSQLGWTVLRFKDKEIDEQVERVMSAVMKTIMQKESSLESQKKLLK